MLAQIGLGLAFRGLGLGLASKVLALALVDVVKLQYTVNKQ